MYSSLGRRVGRFGPVLRRFSEGIGCGVLKVRFNDFFFDKCCLDPFFIWASS